MLSANNVAMQINKAMIHGVVISSVSHHGPALKIDSLRGSTHAETCSAELENKQPVYGCFVFLSACDMRVESRTHRHERGKRQAEYDQIHA